MIMFPQYMWLYLLLAVPLIPVLYGVKMSLRRRRVKEMGNPELVEALMPSRSASKGWVKAVLISLAMVFFIIGLARPQIGARMAEKKKHGAEIMIVLDVSNSMLAEDYSPNRLERAKLSISRLCDKLRDDRIGLVLFAGSSFVQLPVTSDYISAKMFLPEVSTSSIPVQGTAMADAILLAVKCFSAQSEKNRVIIVISDGENHEGDPVAAAKTAAEAGARVYAIGVGSAEGQPIPLDGELIKDKDGNIVVTHLDEEILRKVASEGHGAYIHAGNDEFGLNPVIADIRRLEDEEFGSVVFEEYNELFMYFFGVSFLLLVIAGVIGERKNKRKLFDDK